MSDPDDIERWDIPYVEDPHKRPENLPTNALNKRSDWKYEPPEEEEEIRPPTAQEIEDIRAAAHEEGFSQGKEQGYAEGIEQGKAEGLEQGLAEGKEKGYEEGFTQGEAAVNHLTEQWTSLVDKLYDPLSRADEEVKKQLSKLAVALARAVILSETKNNDDIVLQALEKGIAALPVNESQIQILLHPDDIAIVKNAYSEQVLTEKKWELSASTSIAQGGCEIVAKNNAVDVSIEKRCKDVLDSFLLNNGLTDD